MRFLAHIFMFSCFFPYLDFIRIGTDTQPNSMIIGTVIILVCKKPKLNTPLILLWITFGLSLLCVFTSELDTFHTAKLVLNYLAPTLVAWAGYIVFCELKYEVKFRTFLIYTLIYLFVGIMQAYFINDFMTFILNEGRGILVGGRGVISLTTEPAFYGTNCLFFLVFAIINYNKKQNFLLFILLMFQMAILAKSSTAFAILGGSLIFFSLVMLIRLKVLYVLALLIFTLVITVYSDQILDSIENSRGGRIINKVIKDPWLIAEVDQSIAVRASNTFAPYFVIRHNYFLPMGFGRFQSFLIKLNGEGRYKKLITRVTMIQRQRIVGGINMVLFHLGFLGLLFPLAIYLAFKKLLYKNLNLFAFILFITILFTMIQLMLSLIGLIIASAIYQSKLEEERRKKIKLAQ